MDRLFIPTLHSFAMGNTFTGSCGAFRFQADPKVVKLTQKEVDFENSYIRAEYWHGPFCYELSQKEGEQNFPMTQEGVDAMKAWLEEHI